MKIENVKSRDFQAGQQRSTKCPHVIETECAENRLLFDKVGNRLGRRGRAFKSPRPDQFTNAPPLPRYVHIGGFTGGSIMSGPAGSGSGPGRSGSSGLGSGRGGLGSGSSMVSLLYATSVRI